jgi:hypothetical protein
MNQEYNQDPKIKKHKWLAWSLGWIFIASSRPLLSLANPGTIEQSLW